MPSALFNLDQLAFAVDALTLCCNWPVGVLITATAIDAGTPLPHVEIFPFDTCGDRITQDRCLHIDRSWHTVLGVSGPTSLIDVSTGSPRQAADEGTGHLVHLVDSTGRRATRLSTVDRRGSPIHVSVNLIGGDLDTWCLRQLYALVAFQYIS